MRGSFFAATQIINATIALTAEERSGRASSGPASASLGSDVARRRRASGISIPFVDPALTAPDAPVRWLACPAAPVLEAFSERPANPSTPALAIARLSSAAHVLICPGGEEEVLLRDSNRALTLRLYGARASMAPVDASFVLPAAPNARRATPTIGTAVDLLFHPRHQAHRSARRLLLRDALVTLDARCAGASYRETAALIFGAEFVRAEWSGRSSWLKERMRRARAAGEALRDGGYHKLLRDGCRCGA